MWLVGKLIHFFSEFNIYVIDSVIKYNTNMCRIVNICWGIPDWAWAEFVLKPH